MHERFNFTSGTYVKWGSGLDKVSKIPFLCANDTRGAKAFPDLSSVASRLIVGAANDEEVAYELGKSFANEEKSFGGNWLWSPMADVINRGVSVYSL